MLRVVAIAGYLDDPETERRVHTLAHAGAVETAEIESQDLARRRLRLRGDRGTDIAVSLPRGASLRDGALLYLDAERAVLLRVRPAAWLELVPCDAAGALQLGFLAGHLHWRVEFCGMRLRVALDGPRADYLARIADRLPAGTVRVIEPHEAGAVTPAAGCP